MGDNCSYEKKTLFPGDKGVRTEGKNLSEVHSEGGNLGFRIYPMHSMLFWEQHG